MTTTIVSMYFNLKALPDTSAEVRPMEFYLEKGRAVLSLPNPIVFFCDSETKPLIQALRDELMLCVSLRLFMIAEVLLFIIKMGCLAVI